MLAECLCMLDGTKPIQAPVLDVDQTLQHHNVFFVHMLCHLSKSQAMMLLEICPSKDLTIVGLLESEFPAIKATNDLPTPVITPRTVAYIHALIIDTVTYSLSETTYARALQTENMARKELASMPLVDFRAELRIAMTSYYEGILKLEGASGERKAVAAYKHKIRSMIPPPAAEDDGAAAAGATEGIQSSQTQPEAEPAAEPEAGVRKGPGAGRAGRSSSNKTGP